MIELGFFGAAGEVTGSCTIVRTSDACVMVDLGMHQGEEVADEHNRRMPEINPRELDAVVLTHAHLDHCGRLPLLARAGYQGRIHATMPSCELAQIILRDSAALQEADAERFNRRFRQGQAPTQPLYTSAEAEATFRLFEPTGYTVARTIAPGISVRFMDAGHILGSSSVHMTIHDGGRTVNLVFSGDVGVRNSPILRDPVTPVPADVVVLESTYGDRDHRDRAQTVQEFLGILKEAQTLGGKVLIPAFAVGRTQDVLYHVGEFLRDGAIKPMPVYVDSPMADETTSLYRRHPEVYDPETRKRICDGESPLRFPGLTFTRSADESKRLNDAKGCMLVIAASGMCTGGRIVHHLRHNLFKPETSVVIVGYQGQGTLGRRLVDGAKKVTIQGEQVLVRARVHTLGGFSAHAGQSQLLDWASAFGPGKPKVFLNHGEDGPRTALAEKLKSRFGYTSTLPAYGQWFTL